MLYLCLTFDYELFFGDNFGSCDEILFQPTLKLIDMLSQKKISATFFADVCSVSQSLKYNQTSYVDKFTRQIQYMVQRGQDVQLHIHSHWFYSKWENGTWKFSSKGYRIHEFGFGSEGAGRIIEEGVKYLKHSLQSVKSDYECIAYRAGGFSFQPHQKLVVELYRNGIRIDSSIAPELFSDSETNRYDYRKKVKKINWHISSDLEWWEDSENEMTLLEIPIATINKSVPVFLAKRLFMPNSIKLCLAKPRGTYIKNQTFKENKMKAIIRYVLGFNAISLDAYSADYLYDQVKRFYKKIIYKNDNKTDYIVALIGHPKLIDDRYISNLIKFIELIKYDTRFSFISINEAYRMIRKS